MVKKSISKEKKEIKQALDKGKLIIGTEETFKAIRRNLLVKVFISENCSCGDDIKHLCNINNIDVIELSYSNEELGAICKKPFSISVLGMKQ